MDEDRILAALEGVQTSLQRLEAGQRELADFATTKFQQIDARFEQIDARFEQIDARFEQIDARFEQIDARFEQIDARFEQIDARFGQIDSRLQHIEDRLQKIENQATEFRVIVMERFERVEDRLTALLEDVSVNMAAVGYLNRKHEHDRDDVRLLREIVFKMSMQINRLETGFDDMRKRAS